MHYFRNNLINIGIVLHLSKIDPPIFKNHNSHFQITSWSHNFWILSSKENFFPFFYEKPKQRKEEQTSLVPERCLRRKLCREETSESAWRKPRACQTMGPDLQIQIWRTKVKVLSARWNISSSGSRLPSKRQEEKKTRNTSLQRKTPWRNASLWVPTPRSSTSKLAGGRSFWNLSRWIYTPSSFSFHRNYCPPVEHPDF